MIEIDDEKLKKAIASREIDRLNKIPDKDKETYIKAYTDGVLDGIELLIERIDEQLEEGTNGVI